MPTTATYGFRYPGPDDDPNGPEDMQFLAQDVEDTLETLIPNSGVLTNLAVTPATGWSMNVNEHITIGKIMWLHLALDRTGAQIDASAAGNISDMVIATITDAAKRPAINAYGAFKSGLTSGAFQINSATGEVSIVDMHSSSRIETGHTLHVGVPYFIP